MPVSPDRTYYSLKIYILYKQIYIEFSSTIVPYTCPWLHHIHTHQNSISVNLLSKQMITGYIFLDIQVLCITQNELQLNITKVTEGQLSSTWSSISNIWYNWIDMHHDRGTGPFILPWCKGKLCLSNTMKRSSPALSIYFKGKLSFHSYKIALSGFAYSMMYYWN
jgi:hypothetical protein